jgi:ABC-type antimicrobial peptide transport system permease subunit
MRRDSVAGIFGILITVGLLIFGLYAVASVPSRPSDYDDLRNECEGERGETDIDYRYECYEVDGETVCSEVPYVVPAPMSPLCQAFFAGKIKVPEEPTTDYFPFFNFHAYPGMLVIIIAILLVVGVVAAIFKR